MASKFITYTDHGVAESTLIRATRVGHNYNLVATVDIDNGSVAKLGGRAKDTNSAGVSDLWTAEIPAVSDKIVFILTPPEIYEQFTTKMQEESNFYNAAGEAMRGYEIVDTDRFTISAEAFDDEADPKVGEYVGVTGTGYKLTTLGTEEPASSRGFYGEIYEIAPNGNYRIIVRRNERVFS